MERRRFLAVGSAAMIPAFAGCSTPEEGGEDGEGEEGDEREEGGEQED
ncbi:hypothetical protein [Haloarcula amylovorans]|nr:hypothetical protein [Halomicroarcula amylolytica]